MSKEPKEIFHGTFFSLFSDGTIGCSDGVGFIGELEIKEVKELYEALKTLFDKEKYERV